MAKPDTRRPQKLEPPPIYLETLAALVGRDPAFLQGERVSEPVAPDVVPIRPGHGAQRWTALDQLKEAS